MPASVGLWGGIACLIGKHVRSRGQAHATPEGWVSRCARCAIPMARAHGGGKWQVVKTPKRRKAGSRATAGDKFAKAMMRSRAAGARKEAKEVLAAQKAVADEAAAKRRHIHGGVIEEDAPETPAEGKRRLFRRKKRADTGAKPKRARRFFFFRRKPAPETGENAELAIEAGGVSKPKKAKRRWFSRRKKRAAAATEGETPSV